MKLIMTAIVFSHHFKLFFMIFRKETDAALKKLKNEVESLQEEQRKSLENQKESLMEKIKQEVSITLLSLSAYPF
jgi:uncharacterized membrane protein YgcG